MAARMALDLDLPGSYTKLSALSFDSGGNERDKLEEERLMRESRVWFGTFILENILSIDCGKKPGIKASSGAGMRRCRVLLGVVSPFLYSILYSELLTPLVGRMFHAPRSLPAFHSVKKCVAKLLLASESDGLGLQDAITSGGEYLFALG
jgi:hypothetical protein